MMKLIQAFAFLFCAGALSAQISLDDGNLPNVGTTIELGFDTTSVMELDLVNGEQTFDFSNLNPIFPGLEEEFVAASEGENSSEYPDANLMRETGPVENYYRVTPDGLYFMGMAGVDFAPGILPQLLFKADGEIVEFEVPFTYNDSLAQGRVLKSTFASDLVPDSITDQLPVEIDSVRITFDELETQKADGFGTLMLPGPSELENVLRINRSAIGFRTVEAYVTFLGWQDVTASIIMIRPDLAPLFDAFGRNDHYFYVEDQPLNAFSYSMNESGDTATNFQFQNAMISSLNQKTVAENVGISISPNPISSHGSISLSGLSTGKYRIQIVNQEGKQVSSYQIQVHGDTEIPIDVSESSTGAHLLLLFQDENGALAGSEKFIVN